ncbi:hypothetical protein FEDK69T_12670 [Flavobacterium enshiense DK69]|uniref:Uncharacterized protein n=1 Tax=Flavobacterium enshiense DK69 TaxID=1107311 RepID=V6S8V7_9FLAO|nr:hypothetical protein [Flavobacterium enshiense]ESU23118.1 hypothetical protein FEDK69T_12670 [Flavobacterium enshiense DK69]KGO96020.1 hypothetical protein Q767_07075 [Flavobacterium enshiense DK69]
MTLYQKTFQNFQKEYYAYATLAIIGQSCLGGAAAMYILKNGTSFSQMIQLALVVLVCSFVNGSILATQKHKLVFNLILTSVITSTVMITLNTLVI